MAVGDNGRHVQTTAMVRPGPMSLGHHMHRGSAESTVGGPGCTSAPGASQSGSSGSSPYGSGGDGRDSDGD